MSLLSSSHKQFGNGYFNFSHLLLEWGFTPWKRLRVARRVARFQISGWENSPQNLPRADPLRSGKKFDFAKLSVENVENDGVRPINRSRE